jgi:hypothetical protein
MTAIERVFVATEAKRERVPLWIGLFGPSNSGKTFSALRLATGIRQQVGGEIFFVDTEGRRALHYADKFDFRHVDFDAPFRSLDYLHAIRYCAKNGASVIIVDSTSHEHEGEGGYLQLHNLEMQRMSGGDADKAERVKMGAWIRPSAERRQLINGLLQMNLNFIFCFRAKEKIRMVKINNKIEPQELGYMPIAGGEFLFEQTVNVMLHPRSMGVPTWRSDFPGECEMMKCPEQFKELFAKHRGALDEEVGMALALWAHGSERAPGEEGTSPPSPPHSQAPGNPGGGNQDLAPSSGFTPELFQQYDRLLNDAARQCTGETKMAPLLEAWKEIPAAHKPHMKPALDRRHKPTALHALQVNR